MHGKRIAVVTGANRGLGLETCRQLARDHRELTVLLIARDQEKGRAACEQLLKAGGDVRFRRLDVTDEANIRDFYSFMESEFGRWDILVNNVGIMQDRDATVVDIDPALFRRTIEINLVAALLMSQGAIALMRKNNYGRIVNVSSGLGSHRLGFGSDRPAYRVSKAALNALTRVMAAEVRDAKILINTAEPGWLRTDMGGAAAPRSVEQGAEVVVWLATLADGGPSGCNFYGRKRVDW